VAASCSCACSIRASRESSCGEGHHTEGSKPHQNEMPAGAPQKKSGSCSNLPIGRSAEGTSHRPPPGPSCGRGPPRRGWPPTPSQGSQMSAPPPCCSPRRPPAAGRTPPPRALSAPEMLDDPRSARCLGNVTPPTVASVSLGCLLSNVRRCLSSVTQNTSRLHPSLDPPPPQDGEAHPQDVRLLLLVLLDLAAQRLNLGGGVLERRLGRRRGQTDAVGGGSLASFSGPLFGPAQNQSSRGMGLQLGK